MVPSPMRPSPSPALLSSCLRISLNGLSAPSGTEKYPFCWVLKEFPKWSLPHGWPDSLVSISEAIEAACAPRSSAIALSCAPVPRTSSGLPSMLIKVDMVVLLREVGVVAAREALQVEAAHLPEPQVGWHRLVDDRLDLGHRLVGRRTYRGHDRRGEGLGVGTAVDPGVDLEAHQLAARTDHRGHHPVLRGGRPGDLDDAALGLFGALQRPVQIVEDVAHRRQGRLLHVCPPSPSVGSPI